MPRQLGKYMLSCWHRDPNRRPTFSSLVISLSQLKREYFEASELSSPTDSGILSMPRQQISRPSQSNSPSPLEAREHSRSGPSSSLTTPALTPTESQTSQINLNSPGSRLPRLKPVMVVSSEENDILVELPVEKPCPSNSTATTTTTTIVGVCPDGDDSF
ncbi:unnamed protein product [Hymenolepis diminuta]|uniref:PK_Tyr_Ser-Thr domain-containing protein n=1 Tax=Hymenolepis diminuta TaxID=6216 RepID=A0A0R3STB4_HYMDI|nr:unnamed protein product [Hymenolepis diminuta]